MFQNKVYELLVFQSQLLFLFFGPLSMHVNLRNLFAVRRIKQNVLVQVVVDQLCLYVRQFELKTTWCRRISLFVEI